MNHLDQLSRYYIPFAIVLAATMTGRLVKLLAAHPVDRPEAFTIGVIAVVATAAVVAWIERLVTLLIAGPPDEDEDTEP